jgi:hypothetical protein
LPFLAGFHLLRFGRGSGVDRLLPLSISPLSFGIRQQGSIDRPLALRLSLHLRRVGGGGELDRLRARHFCLGARKIGSFPLVPEIDAGRDDDEHEEERGGGGGACTPPGAPAARLLLLACVEEGRRFLIVAAVTLRPGSRRPLSLPPVCQARQGKAGEQIRFAALMPLARIDQPPPRGRRGDLLLQPLGELVPLANQALVADVDYRFRAEPGRPGRHQEIPPRGAEGLDHLADADLVAGDIQELAELGRPTHRLR